MTRRLALIAALALVLLGALLVFGREPVEPEPDGAGATAGAALRTVFVGDSITAGFPPGGAGPDPAFSWVTYAVADDRSPWALEASAARFGDTLAQMAVGFESQVLARDPEAVVFLGGTNDTLRRIPVEESVDRLRSMVTAAQDAGAEVWVVSPPPLEPGFGFDPEPLIVAQADLADEVGVPFVDLRGALTDDGGRWLPGLSSDGIHPTEEGAHRLADAVLSSLE